MEILIKVLTFCGIWLAMVLISGIFTAYLFRHHPRIVRKILGENQPRTHRGRRKAAGMKVY